MANRISYQASDGQGPDGYGGQTRDGYNVSVFVDGYMDSNMFFGRKDAQIYRWLLYKINRTIAISGQDGYAALPARKQQTLEDEQDRIIALLNAVDQGRTSEPHDLVLSENQLEDRIKNISGGRRTPPPRPQPPADPGPPAPPDDPDAGRGQGGRP